MRKPVQRRLIVGNLIVPGTFGLAVLVAAPWANPSAPSTTATALTSSTSDVCYDMVNISVAGRGDIPREGTNQFVMASDGTRLPVSDDYHSDWLDPVVSAPSSAVGPGSYESLYLEYPANMATYEDSINAGVANTEQVIRAIQVSCPDTKFSIVGYSEGADVVRRVTTKIGNQTPNSSGDYEIVDPDDIVGVVILADNGRTRGEAPFPGAENEFQNPDGFNVPFQSGRKSASGAGAISGTSGGFGALNGKVASFCAEGDLTCSAPENIALLQLAANVGRQINVDALERDGLTPATGADVAVVLGRIAIAAFTDIANNPDWMRSDETFLDVLLKVSDPAYDPNAPKAPVSKDYVSAPQLIDVVYLPDKIRKEVIGFIGDNQNTLQVAMSDPYKTTLDHDTGHHFDYWKDADQANGKTMTTAEYAAAWLTHLAQEADQKKATDAAKRENTAVLAADTTTRTAEKANSTNTFASVTTTGAAATTTPSTPTTTTKATVPLVPANLVPQNQAAQNPFAQNPALQYKVAAPTTTTVPTTTVPTTTAVPTTTEQAAVAAETFQVPTVTVPPLTVPTYDVPPAAAIEPDPVPVTVPTTAPVAVEPTTTTAAPTTTTSTTPPVK
ncbi:cutinase family protein [Antrihabitans stalactiti]|uniref:Cutinase family protein n=1 Tax=Antrihabitans stalactiti TaxID=2584121 RepID=A0A848KAR3_9NOCA|nr:cutinase family protein [Antrihabitans stalactiti]NMN95409.1 cutinase family protein [Antrihabitans stalactiti]